MVNLRYDYLLQMVNLSHNNFFQIFKNTLYVNTHAFFLQDIVVEHFEDHLRCEY